MDEIPALSEKEWRAFSLDEIFTVSAGRMLATRDKVPGDRPFISATRSGNGVTGFVGNDNASRDANVLGVNCDGTPCIAFYHPYECIFLSDVKRLHLRNHEDNQFALLFFVPLFAQQSSSYSYGYKFNGQRMLRQKLMLPVDDAGEPDYAYMAAYVQQKRNAMLAKYRAYVEARIVELGKAVEIPALDEKEWKAFNINSLFSTIEATKGKTTSGLVVGEGLPYIAAAKSIIGCQVCSVEVNKEWASNGNGMVFVQLGDGAAGLAHYIPMPFIGMAGKTSVGYSENLNPYNGLFIERCLSSNKTIFSHGHSWTGKRLLNTKVMLPVTDSGNPDYEYMGQYSKNMMLRKYQQYLAFLGVDETAGQGDVLSGQTVKQDV